VTTQKPTKPQLMKTTYVPAFNLLNPTPGSGRLPRPPSGLETKECVGNA